MTSLEETTGDCTELSSVIYPDKELGREQTYVVLSDTPVLDYGDGFTSCPQCDDGTFNIPQAGNSHGYLCKNCGGTTFFFTRVTYFHIQGLLALGTFDSTVREACERSVVVEEESEPAQLDAELPQFLARQVS